jgi:hypothetical protein
MLIDIIGKESARQLYTALLINGSQNLYVIGSVAMLWVFQRAAAL